jgi:hypothetical protein
MSACEQPITNAHCAFLSLLNPFTPHKGGWSLHGSFERLGVKCVHFFQLPNYFRRVDFPRVKNFVVVFKKGHDGYFHGH